MCNIVIRHFIAYCFPPLHHFSDNDFNFIFDAEYCTVRLTHWNFKWRKMGEKNSNSNNGTTENHLNFEGRSKLVFKESVRLVLSVCLSALRCVLFNHSKRYWGRWRDANGKHKSIFHIVLCGTVIQSSYERAHNNFHLLISVRTKLFVVLFFFFSFSSFPAFFFHYIIKIATIAHVSNTLHRWMDWMDGCVCTREKEIHLVNNSLWIFNTIQ